MNGANPSITALIDYDQFCNIGNEQRNIKEIDADELNALIEGEELFQLIDVREQHEFDLEDIGGELIPLGAVLDKADKIKRDRKVVIHCKMGGRSAKAIRDLEDRFAFDNLYNLKGGINSYLKQYKPR